MPRLYVSNDSYPELRDVPPHWPRTATWWRAIRAAARHLDFGLFAGVQAALLAGFVLLDRVVAGSVDAAGDARLWLHAAVVTVALVLFGYLQCSWGGDMMRRHLRAVSDTARHACPRCGQSLAGHLERDGAVRCPECATLVDPDLFRPPYRIPAGCRAFPPWRRVQTEPSPRR